MTAPTGDAAVSTETLRRAAALMRERAGAAAKPWHRWGDKTLPERSGGEAWSADMRGYLGGEWGDHAASWHPDVALDVADWLDMAAFYIQHGEWEPGGVYGSHALAVARRYLGEPSP